MRSLGRSDISDSLEKDLIIILPIFFYMFHKIRLFYYGRRKTKNFPLPVKIISGEIKYKAQILFIYTRVSL